MLDIPVSMNGKFKGTITIHIDEKEETIIEKAKQAPFMQKLLEQTVIKKTIYIAGKMINFVV
jgi:leucyl-tRNA synthetase